MSNFDDIKQERLNKQKQEQQQARDAQQQKQIEKRTNALHRQIVDSLEKQYGVVVKMTLIEFATAAFGKQAIFNKKWRFKRIEIGTWGIDKQRNVVYIVQTRWKPWSASGIQQSNSYSYHWEGIGVLFSLDGLSVGLFRKGILYSHDEFEDSVFEADECVIIGNDITRLPDAIKEIWGKYKNRLYPRNRSS